MSAERASVASGLAWNTIYQMFNTLLSFCAMLVMVRLLTPDVYGRAASAVALISVANAFGSPSFVAHALQLGEGEDPDWTLHWNVSMPLQFLLFLVINLVAIFCWRSATYRPIAGLLHVGAIGILLEWPAQIAGYTLRRNLDFRRLRILQGVSGTFNACAMIAIAALGGGAYALIIGNNVLPAVGLTFDLLVLRKWKPNVQWWSKPDLRSYADARKFGLQNVGSALLARSRAVLEGLLLPVATGFPQIGIMNRGAALHSLSVGRLEGVVMETVYPLLPRAAIDDERFRRIATIFSQVILLTSTSGTIFICIMGRSLSRLLYGVRWAAADPFIMPAALVGLGITMCSLGVNILLARGRLRATLLLNGLTAILGLPIILVALLTHSLYPYIWALAAAQLTAGIVNIVCAAPYLYNSWKHDLIYPPIVVTGVSAIVLLAVAPLLAQLPLAARVIIAAALYGMTAVLTTRLVFPALAAELVQRMPGGAHLRRVLRFAE